MGQAPLSNVYVRLRAAISSSRCLVNVSPNLLCLGTIPWSYIGSEKGAPPPHFLLVDASMRQCGAVSMSRFRRAGFCSYLALLSLYSLWGAIRSHTRSAVMFSVRDLMIQVSVVFMIFSAMSNSSWCVAKRC